MTVTVWPTVRIDEISRPKQWQTIKKEDLTEDGYPVYGANGVIGSYHSFNHDDPTILITCRGATCGSINICQSKSWVTGNAMALDDLELSRVDFRYLIWALKVDGLQDAVTGSAQPQITKESLTRIGVPLPPIEEQRRIAAVLDAADALRAKRRQALAKLDTLTQAIFIDMFGDQRDGRSGKLGDHVVTTSGGTPSRSRQEYFDGGIPWVKSGELAPGWVTDTEEHITAEAVSESSAKLMPPGTVLVAMYGATVGEVATLAVEAATNQAICCLKPTDEVIGPYLAGFLRSMKRKLIGLAAGGAQPNISQTIIRGLVLPLPSVGQQEEYTRRVVTVAEALAMSAESQQRFDTLFASLQQRAFRGEL